MASLINNATILGGLQRANNAEREDRRRAALFEASYKLYVKNVYQLALRLLANVQAAEEITVRVFVTFRRELPRRWDESRVVSRLRDLVIDEALRRLWGRRRKRLKWQAALAQSSPAISNGASPEKTNDVPITRRPLDSVTLNALTYQLPDELRVAFVLHDMEGLSDQAISKLLQLDETVLRRLIARARLELRRLWLSQTQEVLP